VNLPRNSQGVSPAIRRPDDEASSSTGQPQATMPAMPSRHPRVGFLLPELGGGGAERMILALANGFGRAGIPTDMIVMSAQGDFFDELGPDTRLVDLGTRRASRSVPALRRHIQDVGLDVLISGLDHVNVCATAAVMLGPRRPRLLLSQRNTLTHSNRKRIAPVNWLIRRALHRADCVLTVSEGVRQDLLEHHGLPPERVVTTYNPVVSQAMLDLAQEEPVAIPGLEQRRYVLACGRLEPQKGFDVLIEAFTRIATACPDIDLVILGRGQLRDALQQQAAGAGIAGRVHLPGFARNPFALMRRAELFILSSRHEGLPGVLIQAMACGTKVVSTDCESGPREILEGGRYGSLVPVGNVDALAQAIRTSLEQPLEADVRARAGDFSVDTVVRRHIELVMKVLA
jgi:glycosyltransferase involved in cell wall biosynthesis